MADAMLVAGGLDSSSVPRAFKVDASGALLTAGSAAGGSTPTTQVSPASIATAQVSVGTSATLIAAARTGRGSITIINEGTTDVRLGVAGVTTGAGLLLAGTKGQSITLTTSAAVYGIVGTGTQAVSVVEAF